MTRRIATAIGRRPLPTALGVSWATLRFGDRVSGLEAHLEAVRDVVRPLATLGDAS